MAESDELDFSDLKVQAEQLLEIYKEQTSELQKQAQVKHTALSGSSMPDSTDGLKKENAAKKEAIIIDGQLTQKKKDQIAAQQLVNQLTSAYRGELKDTTAIQGAAAESIIRMNLEIKKLNLEYQKGDETLRTKLGPQILDLQNKVNKANEAIGRFQGSVGNYAKAGQAFGESVHKSAEVLRGMTGILGVLGETLGVNKELTEGLMKAHSMSREAMRSLTEVQAAFNEKEEEGIDIKKEAIVVNEEGIDIKKEAIVVNEEEGESQLAALGIIGLVVGAITAAVVIYKTWNESKKISEEATKADTEAEKANVEIKKDLLKVEQDLELQEGKTTKSKISNSEALSKGANSNVLAAAARDAKMKELRNQAGQYEGATRPQGMDVSNNVYLTRHQAFMDAKAVIDDDYNKRTANSYGLYSKTVDLNNSENAEKNKKLQDEIQISMDKRNENSLAGAIKLAEDTRKMKLDEVKNDEQEANNKQLIEQEYLDAVDAAKEKYAAKDAERRKKELEERKRQLAEFEELQRKANEVMKQLTEEDLKEAEARQKELDILIKYNEEMDKLHDKMQDTHALDKDNLKIRQDKLQIDADKDNPTKLKADKVQLQKDTFTLYDEENLQKRAAIGKAEQDESARAIKMISDKKALAARLKQIDDDAKKAIDDANADTALKKQEYLQKELDAKKKLTDAEKKSIQEGLKALQDSLQQQNKIRQQSLAEQMTSLQQQVDQDTQLNAAGRKNGLAQSMAAENSIAVQQLNLQTQSEGINSAMSLANILLNLQKTGGFYEGTPDTGGPGILDSRGGMLAMLHPNEAVIPKARNEEYPGLAKAWISGNLDTYLAKIAMPEINGVDMTEVKQELTEIKKVLLNQPWAVAYNQGGKAIIEEHTGEGKKTRIIEEPLSIRTR